MTWYFKKYKYPIIYVILVISTLLCGCDKADNKQLSPQIKKGVVDSNITKTNNVPASNEAGVQKVLIKDNDFAAAPEIKEMIKGAQKLIFEQYYVNTDNKYAQTVVKWLKKISENEAIYKKDMRHGISMALVDLNNDNIDDILTIPGAGWCGSRGCSVFVFLSSEYEQPYKINKSFNSYVPNYVLSTTTNGLNDLLILNKFVCKFQKYDSDYKDGYYNNDYYVCK